MTASPRLGPELVGTTHPAVRADVERGRLRAFAHATGETRAVYTDLAAARAGGHHDLPAPPTFVFALASTGGDDGFGWLVELGVDLRHVLHGEQSFTYHNLTHAGDVLSLESTLVDVYSKRGGALQFLVRETTVHRVDAGGGDGGPVADMCMTLVVRDPGGAR